MSDTSTKRWTPVELELVDRRREGTAPLFMCLVNGQPAKLVDLRVDDNAVIVATVDVHANRVQARLEPGVMGSIQLDGQEVACAEFGYRLDGAVNRRTRLDLFVDSLHTVVKAGGERP